MRPRSLSTLALLTALLSGVALAQPPANLIPNPEFRPARGNAPTGWTTWSPLPALAPASAIIPGSAGNSLRLVSRSGDSFGKWLSAPIQIRAGSYYEFDVLYSAEAVPDERNSVSAMLSWNSGDGKPVQRDYVDRISDAGSGWRRASRTLRSPAKAANVVVELWLRWAAGGSVRFRNPRLIEVAAPPKRTVRVVTTRIPAQSGTTLDRNMKYMAEVLDRAGQEKPDVILLTENFVNRGIPGPPHESAQPVPGPATEILGAKARQYKSYVITSLLESDAGRVHITAVLIDREGRLAGKYRKTHLPLAEAEDGVSPGNDYPVFDTDFGRIGMLICWDNWFPEPARIMRLKGAEVIFLPIAGDPAARHWDAVTRARAMDNGVFLVASVSNGSTSRVVDPDGEVLAETGQGIAAADLDLSKETRTYWLSVGAADGEARSVYFKERRPESYGPLVNGSERH